MRLCIPYRRELAERALCKIGGSHMEASGHAVGQGVLTLAAVEVRLSHLEGQED